MKKGKVQIGDIFIDKTMSPDSAYRTGVVTEIVSNESGTSCRLQSGTKRWCWISLSGLKTNPVYEYRGHIDLDEILGRILAPFKEKNSEE